MKVTRLYTGSDGESHFEDIDIPLASIGGVNRRDVDRRSKPMKATEIIFRETGGQYEHTWHNAPRRQFVITLEGGSEIEVGDGTRRQFGPGGILLAEDTTGRGHISRALNNKPRKMIFVPLD